jgi:hypothetical protein
MRNLVSNRPLLGAVIAGFAGFLLDGGISLGAGEGVVTALVGGLVVGVAITGALMLANIAGRRRGLR